MWPEGSLSNKASVFSLQRQAGLCISRRSCWRRCSLRGSHRGDPVQSGGGLVLLEPRAHVESGEDFQGKPSPEHTHRCLNCSSDEPSPLLSTPITATLWAFLCFPYAHAPMPHIKLPVSSLVDEAPAVKTWDWS